MLVNHRTKKDTDFFDNEKWVSENLDHLNRNDEQQTFQYVTLHHPLGGMSFKMFSFEPISKNMSLKQLSRYADAVTVCCFDTFDQELHTKENLLNDKSNETAVGNIAYVALHHSSAVIRRRAIRQIEIWKQSKDSQMCICQ